MSRILIVENDRAVASFIQKALLAQGWSTETANDGQEAIRSGIEEDFDLVVLDMGLPRDGGFDVLESLRSCDRTVPILALSGVRTPGNAARCLDMGADDYLTKPFQVDELLARIRARLRTTSRAPSGITVGDVRLDPGTRGVTVGGRSIELTLREFALLETMLRHPGQVLNRDQLRRHSWGHSGDNGDHLVNVYVSVLRKKLGRDIVETVRGVGYRLRVRAA